MTYSQASTLLRNPRPPLRNDFEHQPHHPQMLPTRRLPAAGGGERDSAQQSSSCAGVTLDALHQIAGSGRQSERELSAGEDLFTAGEPCNSLYILTKGWAVLYTLLEDGRRQILHFALPGAVLSRHPLVNTAATYSVQALSDSAVHVIPHEALQPIFEEHPEFGVRLAHWLCHDRCVAFDHLTSIGRGSARERVAHLLLELFVRCRAQWPGHRIDEMHLPLTQEHIGDATGLSSVHVNRVLRELTKSGVVEFHYHHLKVLDPDRLTDEACADPEVVRLWAGR